MEDYPSLEKRHRPNGRFSFSGEETQTQWKIILLWKRETDPGLKIFQNPQIYTITNNCSCPPEGALSEL